MIFLNVYTLEMLEKNIIRMEFLEFHDVNNSYLISFQHNPDKYFHDAFFLSCFLHFVNNTMNIM